MQKIIYAGLCSLALFAILTTPACTPTPVVDPPSPPAPTCDILSQKTDGAKTFEVVYNSNHLMTKNSVYGTSGLLQNTYDFTYDSNNRFASRVSKDLAGSTTGHTDLIYGGNGKIFQIKTYGSTGALSYQATYEYDSEGRVNRKNDFSFSAGVSAPNGYTVYEYSGTGKRVVRSVYTSGSGSVSITTYTHDSNNNITEETRFNVVGGQSIISSKYVNTFDNKKIITLNYAGFTRTGFLSNVDGNFMANTNNELTQTYISYNSQGVETNRNVTSRTYEYDSNGYPTKMTLTPSTGASQVLTFEYHCH